MKAKSSPLKEPVTLENAFRQSSLIKEIIEAEIKFESSSNTTFKESLYVMSGDLTTCVLGLSFLQNNEAHIDFKESRIRLNNEYCLLNREYGNWANTSDKHLLEKHLI